MQAFQENRKDSAMAKNLEKACLYKTVYYHWGLWCEEGSGE